ncbi:MAG: 5-formyltetrahydrofolate cyclo-ligase [Tissierellia bacterium]|nr:5-formyltetrahydrofolate cyclo-ligase [Tissierellia bacterium]
MKKQLRNKYISLRNDLNEDKKNNLDNLIFSNLIENPFYKKAKSIFTFVSMPSEIDTHKLIKKALDDQKIVLVPKIIDKSIMIATRIYDYDQLYKDKFGIYSVKNTEEFKKPDLTICPGLCFDIFKNRLGYGGGYYDNYIRSHKSRYIGIFYSFQKENKVIVDENDQKLDFILTEKEFF